MVKMAVYSTDAIVIRSREYGESDRLITLFSREKGKIEAIAKGARKPRSTQRGGTQLFTYADFLLYRGKNLDTVSQAQPKESFIHLWNDFDRTIAASGMVELLDTAAPKEQPEPELFTLTLSFLFLLRHVDPYIAQAAFALRLMHSAGYLPALDECGDCGKSLRGEQAFISAEAGGLVCATCKNNRAVKALNPGSVALMHQLYKADLGMLDRLRWNKKVREEILGGLCFFCEHRLEKRLHAWRQGSEFI
ncbi:MAG: DNA repair protein RecO [Candidatus Dichloromethanomonas elyunquensis]|nr:MAG: DNA repair protein RecO [Candidatus Dichloromethanomonas elyunquensis]